MPPSYRCATRPAARRCGAIPVALAEPSGAIVEGVVDAAFETDAGWVVVDFKTDADPGEALDAYLGQVRLYARAIATATGRPPPASSCGSRPSKPFRAARPAGRAFDWTVHPLRGALA